MAVLHSLFVDAHVAELVDVRWGSRYVMGQMSVAYGTCARGRSPHAQKRTPVLMLMTTMRVILQSVQKGISMECGGCNSGESSVRDCEHDGHIHHLL